MDHSKLPTPVGEIVIDDTLEAMIMNYEDDGNPEYTNTVNALNGTGSYNFSPNKNNEEEEHHAQISNMKKLILEHMKSLLNEKVEESKAQLQSVVDTIQRMKQEEESQSLDDSLVVDVDVEEVDKSEDVKHNAILELRCIGPHSKHFSTFFMGSNLEIELSKPMEKCVDEEQHPYIQKFIMPKTHYDIPHSRAKKYKMKHLSLCPSCLHHRLLSITEN
ncbi:hypothetical protein HAX54_005202 [Datura stramonium]|uniref:Uncharacterized protein n=1 Tax=Datura stramonium TaxID=4076 RepID=A0ABS8T8C7_DATST|nr:hypothetical protein [Datura stramonium]